MKLTTLLLLAVSLYAADALTHPGQPRLLLDLDQPLPAHRGEPLLPSPPPALAAERNGSGVLPLHCGVPIPTPPPISNRSLVTSGNTARASVNSRTIPPSIAASSAIARRSAGVLVHTPRRVSTYKSPRHTSRSSGAAINRPVSTESRLERPSPAPGRSMILCRDTAASGKGGATGLYIQNTTTQARKTKAAASRMFFIWLDYIINKRLLSSEQWRSV